MISYAVKATLFSFFIALVANAFMLIVVAPVVVALGITAIFKSDVSGIVDASLIGFRKNKAEYSLKYRGWPEQLLNEIQMTYFKNKYFEPVLESIQGNQIIITK